jgi:hypothetical protein
LRGKERISKTEIDELKTDSNIKTAENCIGASVALERVTGLDLI